jgi:hypothetical protein
VRKFVAKISPQQQAIQALAQALGDGAPKVLFGSANKPGIFSGSSQPIKKAAQLCLDERWLEPTGEFEVTGKTRKEKYRVTATGAQVAVERSEPVQLLRQALAATTALANTQDDLLRQQQTLLAALPKQQALIESALQRMRSPAATPALSSKWRDEALHYLQTYQAQHIQAFCSLPDLFANVVKKHGVSIGQFHDGMRALVQAGQVRLHPFTGARYALEREEYALLAGKEIMYYAERLANP